MNRQINIITVTYLLIISLLCNAMDQKDGNKLNILAEIAHTVNLYAAHCITDDSFVVNSSDGCSIINWRTRDEKLLRAHEPFYCLDLTVDTKKQKIMFSYFNTVHMYDAQGTKEWSKEEENDIEKLAFHPSEKAIFIYSSKASFKGKSFAIITQNYTDENNRSKRCFAGNCSEVIDFHPSEPAMSMLYDSRLGLYALADSDYSKNSIDFGFCGFNFCKYSPDGTFIIAGGKPMIFKINPKTRDVSMIVRRKDNESEFENVVFYSNNALMTIAKIVGFQSNTYFLKYWDIKANKLIYEMPPLQSQDCKVSFFPDKKNVLIALDDKYLIMPVPGEVMGGFEGCIL